MGKRKKPTSKPDKPKARKRVREPKRIGPPIILDNRHTRAKFLRHLLNTGSRGRAVTLTGITWTTFTKHLARDPDFAAEVATVEQESLDRLEAVAYQGGVDDPVMALRILERKRPKTWGKKSQVTHDGQIGVSVDIGVMRRELLDDPEYLDYLRNRAIEADGHAGALCPPREQGEVADGSTPRSGGSGAGEGGEGEVPTADR